MRYFWLLPLALGLLCLCAGNATAQFGRPTFKPPPVRPPMRVPPPHMPSPAPGFPEQRPAEPDFPWRRPSELDSPSGRMVDWGAGSLERGKRNSNSKRAVQAASLVGLLASSEGKGALLQAATLFPGSLVRSADWNFTYHPPLDRELILRAANTVGLLATPGGQGALLRAATPSPRPVDLRPMEPEVAREQERPVAPKANNALPPAANGPAENLAWLIPVVIVGGVVLLVVRAAMGQAGDATGRRVRVRIAATPPGEAPESIRRAWVGLELPARAEQDNQRSFGVLSNRAAYSGEGYAVNGAEAVALLADHSPDAAAWWRRNAPHALAGGYQLIFPAEVCELL